MIQHDYSMLFKGEGAFRKFIQKQNYEKFLLSILRKSRLFSDDLELIVNQSNSEGDYFDPESKLSYDVTLLVNERIISNLLKSPKYLASEEYRIQREEHLIEIFRTRLNSKKKKSMPIILFNIIPDILNKFEGAITEHYISDAADEIVRILKTDQSLNLGQNIVLLVSFTCSNSFYIRTLNPESKLDLHYISEYSEELYPFRIISSNLKIVQSRGEF